MRRARVIVGAVMPAPRWAIGGEMTHLFGLRRTSGSPQKSVLEPRLSRPPRSPGGDHRVGLEPHQVLAPFQTATPRCENSLLSAPIQGKGAGMQQPDWTSIVTALVGIAGLLLCGLPNVGGTSHQTRRRGSNCRTQRGPVGSPSSGAGRGRLHRRDSPASEERRVTR